MKFIAHRGNINGPCSKENNPDYIKKTLSLGYDVEIDIWLIKNQYFLGHDTPEYLVDRDFFQDSRIWVHCKNVETFMNLVKFPNINCFLQDNEQMVITSQGYLWAHSRCKEYNDKTIIVSLEEGWKFKEKLPYALCSDYLFDFPNIKSELPFKVLVIDIDGIMTDGTKLYDREAKVLGKKYCDLDFTAIKRFQSSGISVCFFSGDKIVNYEMAESRKIKFFHNTPGENKVDLLHTIKEFYNTDKIAYVGDDYYDIDIMREVSLSFCPQTSPNIVKKSSKYILPIDAGKGVIAKIYDMYEDILPNVYPKDSLDVNPK